MTSRISTFIFIVFTACSYNKQSVPAAKDTPDSAIDKRIMLRQYKKIRVNSSDTTADLNSFIEIAGDSIYYYSPSQKFRAMLHYDSNLYWTKLYPAYKVYTALPEKDQSILIFVPDSTFAQVNIWRDLAEGDREYFRK